MIRIGLTGSIGMGKTVAGRCFRRFGVPVHDSDEAVHRLYAGQAACQVEALFPGTTIDGVVDRRRLMDDLLAKPEKLPALEALIHPLVDHDRAVFLADSRRSGFRLAVLDIPLLFEKNLDGTVDVNVVVHADEAVQKMRVLARQGMTEERFAAIMRRQIPSREKIRRAHFVLSSDFGIRSMERQVTALIRALSAPAQG